MIALFVTVIVSKCFVFSLGVGMEKEKAKSKPVEGRRHHL